MGRPNNVFHVTADDVLQVLLVMKCLYNIFITLVNLVSVQVYTCSSNHGTAEDNNGDGDSRLRYWLAIMLVLVLNFDLGLAPLVLVLNL